MTEKFETPRRDALERGDTRYLGRLCPYHPERNGKRYSSDNSCVACTHEKFIARRRRRLATDPEYRERERERQRAARRRARKRAQRQRVLKKRTRRG
jgi:hypothetical protein